jgi:hypothetical protein
MSYAYIRSEPGLWTVGHYDGGGRWEPESDHAKEELAAARVHYLNGGNPAHDQLVETMQQVRAFIVMANGDKAPLPREALRRIDAALAAAGEGGAS